MFRPPDLQLIGTSPPRQHAIAAIAAIGPPGLIAPVSSAQDDGGVFLVPPCRPVNKTEELLVSLVAPAF